MQIHGFGNKEDNKIPWWVWSIVMFSLTGVLCFKIIVTPFNMQFDFSSFLSLLLALFSVSLAALFYFKATDTSNAFYDNTYKFSQEVANLLARIESGFGERLRHLDDSYRGISDRFDQLPNQFNIFEVEDKLEDGKADLEEINEERKKLLNEFLEKVKLRDEEKEDFLNELNEKDARLKKAQEEIEALKSRIDMADLRSPMRYQTDANMIWTKEDETYLILSNYIKHLKNKGIWKKDSPLESKDIMTSFYDFAKHVLPPSLGTFLYDTHIIDSHYNLTAKGYRVLQRNLPQLVV